MSWRDIPDAELPEDGFLAAATLRDMRDNFAAMAEGTPGAPPIQIAALEKRLRALIVASSALSNATPVTRGALWSRDFGGLNGVFAPAEGMHVRFRNVSDTPLKVRVEAVFSHSGSAQKRLRLMKDGVIQQAINYDTRILFDAVEIAAGEAATLLVQATFDSGSSSTDAVYLDKLWAWLE